MSLFVRVVTHYGSNESNDSLGVFSVYVRGWIYMCMWVGWLGVLEGCGVLEGGGEEKLCHYMTFVTFSLLVREKFYSINLIKMTKN